MDLPEGNYYLKESNTQDIYFLSPEAFCFSITRDDNRKYSEVSYQAVNHLKNCQIQLFKYYYKKSDKEQNNKIPLQGAKFGLYAKNDILDATRVAFDSIKNSIEEIDIETALVSGEILKEVCTEADADAIMQMILPCLLYTSPSPRD